MAFMCSICEEESTRICVRCTKDSCDNHLCEKCRRCSDCCECEVRLSEPVRPAFRGAVPAEPLPEPGPEAVFEPPVAEPPAEPSVAEPRAEPPVTEAGPLAEEPLQVPEPDPAALTEPQPFGTGFGG